VDPRAILDDLEKRKFLTVPGLELRSFGRPARSQSLYRLSYPGSYIYIYIYIYIYSLIQTTREPQRVAHRTLGTSGLYLKKQRKTKYFSINYKNEGIERKNETT
jgi:hypothetical protein